MSKKKTNIKTSEKKGTTKIPNVPDTEVIVENAEISKIEKMSEFKDSVTKVQQEGLDPNRRVDLMKIMHETFRMDPNAAEKYKISQETVDKINEVTAIGQIAILSCEVLYAKNPFALKMNAAELNTVIDLGKAVGLNIDTKALPEPDDKGVVEVPSTAIKIDNDTKNQIEHEKTIEDSAPEMDVEKIYNDEEAISKALQYIFTQNKTSVFRSVDNAIQFIKNVRTHAANVSGNESNKLKVESMTLKDWFNDFTKLFKPTLLFNGIGRHMTSITHYTKSPVVAFLTLRNASKDKKTGIPTHDDSYIAELTKTIICWVIDSDIESYKKSIENLDPEKNKDEIEKCNNAIKYKTECRNLVTNPTFDFVANLIDNLKSDKSELKQPALRTCAEIRKSYYSDIDFKNNTFINLNHNTQQYAGIITNLFKDPSERSDQYVESNITELVKLDNTQNAAEAEKKAEEPKKECEKKAEKKSKKA